MFRSRLFLVQSLQTASMLSARATMLLTLGSRQFFSIGLAETQQPRLVLERHSGLDDTRTWPMQHLMMIAMAARAAERGPAGVMRGEDFSLGRASAGSTCASRSANKDRCVVTFVPNHLSRPLCATVTPVRGFIPNADSQRPRSRHVAGSALLVSIRRSVIEAFDASRAHCAPKVRSRKPRGLPPFRAPAIVSATLPTVR